MTSEICSELDQLLTNWSREGQRVLLLARQVIPEADIDDTYIDSSELSETLLSLSDLVAVGMIAIVDPPRPEIPDVIRACRSGGIRVVMVQ
jgi:sodium/potassium-transporting ATPase subunit alpha